MRHSLQEHPHTATEMTISKSSLMAIDCDSSCLDHYLQNLWGADHALPPHNPDASVKKCLSGDFKRRN